MGWEGGYASRVGRGELCSFLGINHQEFDSFDIWGCVEPLSSYGGVEERAEISRWRRDKLLWLTLCRDQK